MNLGKFTGLASLASMILLANGFLNFADAGSSSAGHKDVWFPYTYPAPSSVRLAGSLSHPKYVTVFSKEPILCRKVESFYNISLRKLEGLEAYNARGTGVENRSFFPDRDLGDYSTSFIDDNPDDLVKLGLEPLNFQSIDNGFSIASVSLKNNPLAITLKDRSFDTTASGVTFTIFSTDAYLLKGSVGKSSDIASETILNLGIDSLAKAQPLWAGRASSLDWPMYLLQFWPWMKHSLDVFAYVNQHANRSTDVIDLSPSINSQGVIIRFIEFEGRLYEVMNPTFNLRLPINPHDEPALFDAEAPIVIAEVTPHGVHDVCYIQLQPNAEQW